MRRSLASLYVVAVLGCAAQTTMPQQPKEPHFVCGLSHPTIAEQLAMGAVATILLGGVVATGYFAIGGEAPLR